MKTRRRKMTTVKHRKKTTAGRASSVADLRRKLHQQTRELAEAQKHLAEALEQQTATSEVLKIISRSAFDLQSVLDSLVENAVRLCSADKGLISRRDGELYHFAASYGHSPEFVEFVKRNPTRLLAQPHRGLLLQARPFSPAPHSVVSKQELKERLMAAVDYFNDDPVLDLQARQGRLI
jgi:hypothetical protein